jgi:hypothetical protein
VTVSGTPAMFVEQLDAVWVRQAYATDPSRFGDYAVVAGGYNYPYWDPARFDRSIDGILAAYRETGAKHIFWVKLREVEPQYVTAGAWNQVQPYMWYFPTVNAHLERALERHPDLTLVDWTAAANRPGITYDAIHLNTTGATLYASLIRAAVDETAVRVAAGGVVQVQVPEAAGAAAAALNLTTTATRRTGFFTAFPCDQPTPVVSNLNHVRAQTVAAAAIVPVAPDGTVCVRTETDAAVIVDVAGTFPAGAGLVPVGPRRLVDTRGSGARQPAGEPLRVGVAGIDGVPADAVAVAVNVTVTDAARAGFASVTPCGAPPAGTSNVNFGPGAATPNVAIVAPGTGGEICVVADADAHLIVDLQAAFDADAEVVMGTAVRALDTRASGRPAPGAVLEVATGAAGATGVVVNLTATQTAADGFLTALPCGQPVPVASNLNTSTRRDVANLAIVQPDAAGRVCVYVDGDTHVIVDVLGSFGATFAGRSPLRLSDSRS